MKNYHYIASVLKSYFDSRNGFTNEEQEASFARQLTQPDYRRALLLELESALVDPDVSWVRWFTDYFVENDFEGEADARALAKELLYDPAVEIELKSNP